MPTLDMPKFTLDLETKIFSAKAGVTEVDVQVDLYSDWKEAVLAGAGNALQYPPALRSVGGDPITATQDLGATFFLINGYKIRPDEADHELTLVGNLWTDPSTEALIVPTLGTYTVLVKQQVSNLVDSSVARLDLAQLLQAVYIDDTNGDDSNDGTPTSPVQTAAAARVIADAQNLRAYNFRGSITLAQDHVGWTFLGDSAEKNDVVILGGYDVNDSRFESCVLSGAVSGQIDARDCSLDIVTNLNGTFRRCGFLSDFTIASNADILFESCYSEVAGSDTPRVSFVGPIANANFRNYSGGLELQDVTTLITVSVDLDPGHLKMLDGQGNTGGEVLVRGTGRKTIGSTVGTTIISDGLVEAPDLKLVKRVLVERVVISADGTSVTIYEEDGTTVAATLSVTSDGLIRTRTS